jgi:hypothetical protein
MRGYKLVILDSHTQQGATSLSSLAVVMDGVVVRLVPMACALGAVASTHCVIAPARVDVVGRVGGRV